MANNRSPYPVLSASVKGSFAYKTVKDRMPIIVTKVIDFLCRNKNLVDSNSSATEDTSEDLKAIIGKLSMLRSEMQTNKPLRLFSPSAVSCHNDIHIWNQCLEHAMEDSLPVRWFEAPWLLVECYMYRVIHAAFEDSSHFKTLDPFCHLKEEAFVGHKDAIDQLSSFTVNAIENLKENNGCNLQESFLKMLQFCLWGNRNDLSLSAGSVDQKSTGFIDTAINLQSRILINDSVDIWKYVEELSRNNSPREMSIIMDNSGLEMIADLCLAVLCLSVKLFDRILLYVKRMPWFVSDVTSKDIQWALEEMRNCHDSPDLKRLAEMCQTFIHSNQLQVIEENFWTSPLPYNAMQIQESKLYEQLSRSHLLVFKGDLNYRKLGGDINWPSTTPFSTFLQGFHPAPLICLRTIKAEIICGLAPSRAEELQAADKDWMVTGENGLIQFHSCP